MPPWLNFTLMVVVIFVQLIGFFGLLLVFFPGLTVIWIGQLAWAISTGFNQSHGPWQFGLTITLFVINTILMVAGSLVDNLFMAGGAAKKGAKWWVLVITWLVMIVVSFLATPLGGLAAALLTLFFIEWIRIKDHKQAFRSTTALVTGMGWSVLVRLGIAILMMGIWVLWVLFL